MNYLFDVVGHTVSSFLVSHAGFGKIHVNAEPGSPALSLDAGGDVNVSHNVACALGVIIVFFGIAVSGLSVRLLLDALQSW
jgi:hypothetical protein